MNLCEIRRLIVVLPLAAAMSCGVTTPRSPDVASTSDTSAEEITTPPEAHIFRTNVDAGATASVSASDVVEAGTPIPYGGGPVMTGAVGLYLIWYGNWSDNSATTILTTLAANLGVSTYPDTNSSYYGPGGNRILNNTFFGGAYYDAYSAGRSLTESDVAGIVNNAVGHGLGYDPNGVYFVFGSPDVSETLPGGAAMCTDFCGWHTFEAYGNGGTLKYAFVGDPQNCLPQCWAQSPSPNDDPAADAMASVFAHELNESLTDPLLNAWGNGQDGQEVGDRCVGTYGATFTTPNGAQANVTVGGLNYRLQQNLVNVPGYPCETSFISSGNTPATVSFTGPSGPEEAIFVRGTDNQLWFALNDGHLSAWRPLGGYLISSPAAVSWGPDRLDVFVIGTNRQLYHIWSANGGVTWSGFESLGGDCTSDPAAGSLGVNRLDVYVKGGDGALYHKWWANAWSGWERHAAVMTSPPTVTEDPVAHYIDLWFRDQRLEGSYFLWGPSIGWRGPSPTSWSDLGAPTVSGHCRSANVIGAGRLVSTLRDDSLYDWWGEHDLGGFVTSMASAACRGANTDFTVRGASGTLYQNTFTNDGWTGWRLLGSAP